MQYLSERLQFLHISRHILSQTVRMGKAGNELCEGEVLKDAVSKGEFSQSAFYQDTLSRSQEGGSV